MRRLLVLLTAVTLVTAVAAPVFSQAGARGRAAAPTTHTLTVTGNVGNATVLINGEQRSTSLPATLTLSPGTYTVQVRASGYHEFSQSVNLSSNQTVNANLQLITHTLTINSNVAGARVIIDNQDRGAVPFRDNVRPGAYTIVVRAPGYIDFNQRTNVQNNQTINANLQPATAQVSLNLPAAILDRTVSNAAAQVQVFVDGQQVRGTSFDVNAGRRTIRVSSGGVSTEVAMDFVAGRRYTITPSFGFDLREGTAAAAPAPAPAQQQTPPPAEEAQRQSPAVAATYPPSFLEPDSWQLWDAVGSGPLRTYQLSAGGALRENVLGQVDVPPITGWRVVGDRLELLDGRGNVALRFFFAGDRWQEMPRPNAPAGWRPLSFFPFTATGRGGP